MAFKSLVCVVLALSAVAAVVVKKPLAPTPWVIAHRGLSGQYPEHTMAGYQAAIDAGADFFECDLTITKDRVLICRHEPLLSGTTDASAKFPSKITTYIIDGQQFTGVFSTDLTLAEVKTLRAVQAVPFRNQGYNGMFEVPTFEEYLDLALSQNRVVGIYPETKHPTWTNSLPFMAGYDMNDLMLEALTAKGYGGALYSPQWNAQPCFLQSFEINNLKYLHAKTDLPLIQLLGGSGPIPDIPTKTVTDVISDAGLDEVATYASGMGPAKGLFRIATPPTGTMPNPFYGTSTGLVAKIHARGMMVHPYTFRNEDVFLADSYGTDPYSEFDAFYRVEKVDGLFTDWTPSARRYLKQAIQTFNPVVIPYQPAPIGKKPLTTSRPYVIAHRGASGYLPEESAEAYRLAIAQGADFIECDVVVTKDRKLLCRHEPNLCITSDACTVFPEQIKTYLIDGANSTGVHSVDLTLAEIKTLRLFQDRSYRPQAYNKMFQMVTLQEYIRIARNASRVIGIYPETKHPTWFASLSFLKNHKFDDLLLAALTRYGYGGAFGSDSWKANPIYIQSFEVGNLKYLKAKTDIPLVQLLDDITPDNGLTNLEMTTDAKLDEIATYAAGVGPWKDYIVHVNDDGSLAPSTGLVQRIQARGMQVHPYTFRNEDRFLAWPYLADERNEYDLFFKREKINGCFTDFSATLNDYFVQAEKEGVTWSQV